jgi:hypothetical protein
VFQQKEMPKELNDLYSSCKNGQRSPTLDEYLRLISSSLNYFRRSFILVDALDEHLDDESTGQIRLLAELQNLQHNRKTPSTYRLLITSRENRFIQDQLLSCIRINILAKDLDIISYLRSCIVDDSKFKFSRNIRSNPTLGNMIVDKLVQKAHGM